MSCEHSIKYQYRLTELNRGPARPIPRLEVRARCKLCRAAGEWFTVKADRVDNDIKKRRARDNLFERSAQHDPQG